MIAALFLSLLPGPCNLPVPDDGSFAGVAQDPAVDAKIAAAGTDVAKLLELAASLEGGPQQGSVDKVYKRVIEIEPGNEVARKALRHQHYDGKWFESFAELAKYKRDEAAKMKAKGLARFKEDWVPEGDVPFLKMGWTKDAQGVWFDPAEAARAKQADEWKAAGYQFRADDNSWVAPEDLDKWSAVQWKCGGEWLDMAKANEFHSKIPQPWNLVGEHFEVWSTCDWDSANLARQNADKTHVELVRIFGVEPARKPHFFVLNSMQQYNQAAGAQPVLIETEGFSTLHGAYFADAFFDFGAKPPRYLGCGVSYWDRKEEKSAAWGPFFLRWAAAQSFVEGIDPSWSAVADRVADGGRGDLAAYSVPFWSEKRIPRWLRYGAASYVERFLKIPGATAGSDPWEWRKFSCDEIKKAGGLHKLDEIFAFRLDLEDIPGSSRLYQEAGLLVAYLLDGAPDDKELAEKHAAFKTALKSGTKAEVAAAGVALQKSLAKHEKEIKKFATLEEAAK
jgi:hypothetical protein